MLRLASIVLRCGAWVYLVMVIIPSVFAAYQGAWLACLVCLVPGIAFGSLLLWLSGAIARERHLWLAVGLLTFIGVSAAMATGWMYAYAFPVLPVCTTGFWAFGFLSVACLTFAGIRTRKRGQESLAHSRQPQRPEEVAKTLS